MLRCTRLLGRGVRRWVVTGCALLTCLCVASGAQAAVNVTSFTATPSTTLAGGHPNFTTSATFGYSSGTDDLRSVNVDLPPGLLGNPRAVPHCTVAQLNSDSCPAQSKIGTTSVTAKIDLPLVPPVTSTGDVYAVDPVGNEPARIGMVVRPVGGLLGKFALSGPARVHVPGDFGLSVRFDDLPRTLPPLVGLVRVPVTIQGLSLTLNGLVDGGRSAFMTNPTSCIAATTRFQATSYESGTPSGRSSAFTPTDCGGVPFRPTLAFALYTQRANTPAPLLAAVTLPSQEIPRRQGHVRTSAVVLPSGMSINPQALIGLTPCSDAQLNVASAAPETCPASSKVGVAVMVTPLLGTVVGSVYFGQGTATAPLRIFITAKVTQTQTAKFIGVNRLGADGSIVTTLSDLPQTPLDAFVLGFFGGPTGLLVSPGCGTHVGGGLFQSWSGAGAGSLANVSISQTPTGDPCLPAAAARRVESSSPLLDGLSYRKSEAGARARAKRLIPKSMLARRGLR
jgi:hypothetical protein